MDGTARAPPRKGRLTSPVEPRSGEAPISELYERNRYLMSVVRVVDADTLIAAIDLGCRTVVTRVVRLIGIDAPELRTEAGKAAKAAAETWLSVPLQLVIQTKLDRDDRYGRLLGEISRAGDVVTLSTWLVNAGHAVAYSGGQR